MTKSIKINNVEIGEGIPKVCVPITGADVREIGEQAQAISAKRPDLVEWRADFLKDIESLENNKMALAQIEKEMAKTPLIFTYRTKNEGGTGDAAVADYMSLVEAMAKQDYIKLIDVEIFTCGDKANEVIKIVQENGKKVIASYHNFKKTPSEDEIIEILKKMDTAGADILKVAVMPKIKEDVETLLKATAKMSKMTEKPLITMSMAELGSASRIWGEKYGSAVTFALVGTGTAPGQLEFDELKRSLLEVHENLK